MSTLREIRKRLHSIKSIQQLTKAMEMVAASRLHYAHTKAKDAQPYISKIQEVTSLLNQAPTDFKHPLFEEREVKKVGVVVFAADMGLCGPYNKEVFNKTNQFLKNYHPSQVELILVGRKAIDYYKHRDWPILLKISETGEKISYNQMKAFANQLMDWFLKGQLDEIWFIYTHYISMASRKVIAKKFLHIEKSSESKVSTQYLLEPSLNEIYDEILSRYCLTAVQTAVQEAYASELAARIFAMKAATKNAEEMIDKLTLIRNKVRQASITKEMIEITSGSQV